MRPLLCVAVLCLTACYNLRWARFVDESQGKAPAWLCVPDDDATNPAGIQCADLRSFEVRQGSQRPSRGTADAGTGVTSVLARELPRDPGSDVLPL
jgi:hypothetical protein